MLVVVDEKLTVSPDVALAFEATLRLASPNVLFPGVVKVIAWPALATAIAPDVPVIEDVAVSVAVRVCDPDVLSVTENVPAPLVSVELAGSTASPSVDVKCTVPAYAV